MRRGLCSSTMVGRTLVSFGSCFNSRWHGSVGDGGAGRGVLNAVEMTPPPPRPAFYVPPEERDADDASLQFLHRKKQSADGRCEAKEAGTAVGSGKGGETRLHPGQAFAPELHIRPSRARHYMDDKAAGLASTSVYAGHHFLPEEPENSTRPLRVIKNATPESKVAKGTPEVHFLRASCGESIFGVRDTFEGDEKCKKGSVRGESSGDSGGGSAPRKRPLLREMELDLRRLEYYQGTPQYQELLEEFRAKYESSEKNNIGGDSNRSISSSSGINDSDGGPIGGEAMERSYSLAEVKQGLEAQPIDYLRASKPLKVELSSGPRAYDPVTVMQKLGVMRFQGYAFPPTTELGKLRDSEGRELQSNVENHALRDYMCQNVSSTIKAQLAGNQDRHLLYRTLGIDAVQRRQVRAMLSDFDYADRQTAFHVMMSYPYTDWIHVFYVVLVGLALYELQTRCGAYEFYDEYLGLDLRQVPRLKKPFLVGVTVMVMVVALFHPLLVASIATTRFYRIFMRRPIGPP
ncbi:hypothetical protein TcCL_NonESM07609 [Trypanosoma cruzi]|uniref:Transmembrane protein n=1 Tax=Trypanosoma cruzi (strain CL Brener) TaxID=353153 RepID=Q4DAS4_TRYCC|nr:hypothetical protein, conserved [Trypanosoma cruzi]EAN89620.1 hypothetical protein, conserved [Trypanosoma cruzi]RNC42744.1 hypothetical protein TcCL_NonESM07609 [Trypanosoma cruzi]|eukprot:XP_811471.1 hypothetical protein [Trypanosoma cruzi strain CL Brener]